MLGWCLAGIAVRTAAAADEAPIEEVVVTASRTGSVASTLPVALTVRDVDPLAPRGPGLSVAEEVVTVPGLLIRNRFNAAQGPRISIRGFGARSAFGIRGVTVLLDDIPLTLPDGLAQVDLVDPELLGRIEVLRGPSGALYGNASGGVLALRSAEGEERTGEDVGARLGAYGFRKAVVRAAETVPGGSVVVAGTGTRFDGFRAQSRTERWIVHGSNRLALGPGTDLGVVAAALDSPLAEDPGALTAAERAADPTAAAPDNVTYDAGESVTQLQAGARLKIRATEHETVEATVYQVGRAFVGRIPFRYNELGRDATGATASLRSERPVLGRALRWTAALEAGRLHDRRTGWDSDEGRPSGAPTLEQDERALSVGGWGQAQLDVLPALTLLGGARVDRAVYGLADRLLSDGDASDSRTFDSLDGTAGLLVHGPSAQGWVSVSDAHENPAISELSLRPDGESGFADGLGPQRARTAELGTRLRAGRVSADASVFTTWLHDELVPFSDETGRVFYRNAGRSHRHGVELAGAVALPLELEVAAAWTLLQARFDRYRVGGEDLDGNAVPGVPPHHVGLSVGWGTGDGPFLGADVDALSAIAADDANLNASPAQAVLGARASWRETVGRLRLEGRLGVENVLGSPNVDNLRVNASNERFYEPGPPRFVHAGITIGRQPGD